MSLLFSAGADLARLFDGARQPIERFASYLSRLRVLHDGPTPSLVLFTQTNPIALAIVQTRRILEEAVPALAAAPWVIFLDETNDPFFIDAAALSGPFDRDLESVPIWRGPHGYRFLTLSAKVTNPWLVAERIEELATEAWIESGVRFSGPPIAAKSTK